MSSHQQIIRDLLPSTKRRNWSLRLNLSCSCVLFWFGQASLAFSPPDATTLFKNAHRNTHRLISFQATSSRRSRHNQNPHQNFNLEEDGDFVSREFQDDDEDYDNDNPSLDFDFEYDDENDSEYDEEPDYDFNSADNKSNANDQAVVGAHFFSRKPLEDPSFVAPIEGSEELFEKLCSGVGITRPSKVQSLAWPILLKGKHTIVADQTGSGKTLAYLIPLLQRALCTKTNKINGAPKILVLAPTAELADQVRAVCERLSQHVSFNTLVVTATGKYSTSIRDQIRMIQREPIDVLISTPGRLSTIVRTRNSGLDLQSRLQAMVLDEVDVLMMGNGQDNDNTNDTFGPQLRTIGQAASIENTQFVFVTATLPDSIVQTVSKEFPGVAQVRGPGLHRVAPTMTERLIDVSVPSRDNRNSKLGMQVKGKQLLKTLRRTRCRRTLIFCNTVENCRAVENLLKRSDRKRQRFSVRAYHNAMTPEARNANLEIFSQANAGNKQTDLDHILVCTDRAARGVDFGSSPVDHVVVFDFPRDPAEYVRRVGRTARAGRDGIATVFVYGWQLPIARSVMGKTLDALQATDGIMKEQDDTVEYRGGVQGRRQAGEKKRKGGKANNAKDNIVKNNIEEGRLWK